MIIFCFFTTYSQRGKCKLWERLANSNRKEDPIAERFIEVKASPEHAENVDSQPPSSPEAPEGIIERIQERPVSENIVIEADVHRIDYNSPSRTSAATSVQSPSAPSDSQPSGVTATTSPIKLPSSVSDPSSGITDSLDAAASQGPSSN
ncbi:hypothetical protein NPIL_368731 [Nephila pilipes]|uniref:Uncharacterized protein n=1 Tax=Nephila pilipes TaxID=299642 RepID=A0A8X6MRR7_NEPPI|nr:hypothetical protein NPIL_368731 [Nephila pilipes]